MIGPPTFFNDLMDHPDFSPSRTASFRFLSIGGSSVTPAFVNRARDAFGCVVKRAYGSTEAPTVTTCTLTTTPSAWPTPTVARLRPPRSGSDEHGEIQVFGPEVTVGYLDPAHTAAASPKTDGSAPAIWAPSMPTAISPSSGGWATRSSAAARTSTPSRWRHFGVHPAVSQAVVLSEPDDRLRRAGGRRCGGRRPLRPRRVPPLVLRGRRRSLHDPRAA